MLEMKRSTVSFDQTDLMELEVIVTDGDEKSALGFIKRAVYDRILHAQRGKLKSHLDGVSPVESFAQNNK